MSRGRNRSFVTSPFDNRSWVRVSEEMILGAFAELRKAAISFVMSVRPSVPMEQRGFHWKEFDDTWYLSFLRKSVEKIQVLLRSEKNNEYFT